LAADPRLLGAVARGTGRRTYETGGPLRHVARRAGWPARRGARG